MFRVRLWKGILQPNTAFSELHEAEDVAGFFWRVIALVLFSAFLSGLSVYIGLDTEMFTKLIGKETNEHMETMKLMFATGSVGNGIVIPMISMYVSSLLIWFIVRGKVEFYKIITIELYSIFIAILEKALFIVFRLLTGADAHSSPFGFGIIAQLISDHSFFNHFMNSITIFGIWGVVIQIIALKICSSLSLQAISTIVVAIYLAFNMISSLLSLINIDQIFHVL